MLRSDEDLKRFKLHMLKLFVSYIETDPTWQLVLAAPDPVGQTFRDNVKVVKEGELGNYDNVMIAARDMDGLLGTHGGDDNVNHIEHALRPFCYDGDMTLYKSNGRDRLAEQNLTSFFLTKDTVEGGGAVLEGFFQWALNDTTFQFAGAVAATDPELSLLFPDLESKDPVLQAEALKAFGFRKQSVGYIISDTNYDKLRVRSIANPLGAGAGPDPVSVSYFTSDKKAKSLQFNDGKVTRPVREFESPSARENKELRTNVRLLTGNQPSDSLKTFAPGSILDNLAGNGLDNPKPARPKIFSQAQIEQMKGDARVYFDSSVTAEYAGEVLQCKAGLIEEKDFKGKKEDANLVTMTIPSAIMCNNDGRLREDKAGNAAPLPVVFLNFTYPKFNQSEGKGRPFSKFEITNRNKLKDDVVKNVERMIELNMKAVSEESKRQGKPLPFILNFPNAFLRYLEPEQKKAVKECIKNAFEKAASKVSKDNISEFIVLDGGRPLFWEGFSFADKIPPTSGIPVHVAKADMVAIAEEVHSKTGASCPLPMMGEPLGAIGNLAISEEENEEADEYFFRVGAGIHGVIGSARYNNHLKDHLIRINLADSKAPATPPLTRTVPKLNYRVAKYGILGIAKDGSTEGVAQKNQYVIVDPAGSAFSGSAGNLGGAGASGAIYADLGANIRPTNPDGSSVTTLRAGQVVWNNVYMTRPGPKVAGLIHAVGPQFSASGDKVAFRNTLAETFKNIFIQYQNNAPILGRPGLRLPLISGAIFGGKALGAEYYQIFNDALQAGYDQALRDLGVPRIDFGPGLEVCCYEEKERQSLQNVKESKAPVSDRKIPADDKKDSKAGGAKPLDYTMCYATEDVDILVKALLIDQNLIVNENSGLVTGLDGATKHISDGYETYVIPALDEVTSTAVGGFESDTLRQLRESIATGAKKQILIPALVPPPSRHWMTFQVLIDGGNAVLKIHDSAYEMATMPAEVRNKINEYAHLIGNALAAGGKTVKREAGAPTKPQIFNDGINTGLRNIYCGGYTSKRVLSACLHANGTDYWPGCAGDGEELDNSREMRREDARKVNAGAKKGEDLGKRNYINPRRFGQGSSWTLNDPVTPPDAAPTRFDFKKSHDENIEKIFRDNGAGRHLNGYILERLRNRRDADRRSIAPQRAEIDKINRGGVYVMVPGLDTHGLIGNNLVNQKRLIDQWGVAAGLTNKNFLYIQNLRAGHWDLVPNADPAAPVIRTSASDVACGCYTVLKIVAHSGLNNAGIRAILDALPTLTDAEKDTLYGKLILASPERNTPNLGIDAALARKFVSAVIASTVNDTSTPQRRDAVAYTLGASKQLYHEHIDFALQGLERFGINFVQMSTLHDIANVENISSDLERRERIIKILAGQVSDNPAQNARLNNEELINLREYLLLQGVLNPDPIINDIRDYAAEAARVEQNNRQEQLRRKAQADAARKDGAAAISAQKKKAAAAAAALRAKIDTPIATNKVDIGKLVTGIMDDPLYRDAFLNKDNILATISDTDNPLNPLEADYYKCKSIILPAGEVLDNEIVKEFRKQYLVFLLDKYKDKGLSELDALISGYIGASLKDLRNLDGLISDAVKTNNAANAAAKAATPETKEQKAERAKLITYDESQETNEFVKYFIKLQKDLGQRRGDLKGYNIRTSEKGGLVKVDDQGRIYHIVDYKNEKLLEEEIRGMKYSPHKTYECSPFLKCEDVYKMVFRNGKDSMVITFDKKQVDAIMKKANKNPDPAKNLNEKIADLMKKESQDLMNSKFFRGCQVEVEKYPQGMNSKSHVKSVIFVPKANGDYGKSVAYIDIPGTFGLKFKAEVADTNKHIDIVTEKKNSVAAGFAVAGVGLGVASAFGPAVIAAPIAAGLFLPSVFLGSKFKESKEVFSRGDVILHGVVVRINKDGEEVPVKESELNRNEKLAIEHFRSGRVSVKSATKDTSMAPKPSCKAIAVNKLFENSRPLIKGY